MIFGVKTLLYLVRKRYFLLLKIWCENDNIWCENDISSTFDTQILFVVRMSDSQFNSRELWQLKQRPRVRQEQRYVHLVKDTYPNAPRDALKQKKNLPPVTCVTWYVFA